MTPKENKMEPGDLIDQTIATIRASAIAELRVISNGYPQESMTSEEVIAIVNWVLGEATDSLKDTLNNQYPDGQTEQDGWWDGYGSDGFVEVFRGGMPEGELLPRVSKEGPR